MKNFAMTGIAGYVAPRHLKAITETGNRIVAATDPHDAVGVLDPIHSMSASSRSTSVSIVTSRSFGADRRPIVFIICRSVRRTTCTTRTSGWPRLFRQSELQLDARRMGNRGVQPPGLGAPLGFLRDVRGVVVNGFQRERDLSDDSRRYQQRGHLGYGWDADYVDREASWWPGSARISVHVSQLGDSNLDNRSGM
jgi:hypothetical protein